MGALREAFEAVEFGGGSDSDSDGGGSSDDEAGGGADGETGSKRGAPTGSDAEPPQPARKRRPHVAMDPDEFMREQDRRARRREARAQHQHAIQAYYAQGAYHGQSCAVSMLALAEQLGLPPTLDTVWCAIVGASSQQMLQHIDADGHAEVVRRMRDLVRRVCPAAPGGLASAVPLDVGGMVADAPPAAAAASGGGALHSSSSQTMLDSQLGLGDAAEGDARRFDPHLDPIDEENDEGYLRAQAGAATNAEAGLLTSTKTVEQRVAIAESAELRFVLLRHWSLDSAMRYSPYVATRLATWSSRGRARLDLLLAKLGLARAEAQAPFLHLAPELKRKLSRRMAEIGSDYNMPDALYPGFVRDYGWRKARVSASDMVLALLALLQRDAAEGAPQPQPPQPPQPQPQPQPQSPQIQAGFFAAYDALQHFG
ncbi:DNA replication initiation factor cdc45, partial [Coemansia helicoidea]